MEPPFREIDQLTQHQGRTRKNSRQLTVADAGVQRNPPFQRRPYVEAAVAHCVVNTGTCCKMCSGRRVSLMLGVSSAMQSGHVEELYS